MVQEFSHRSAKSEVKEGWSKIELGSAGENRAKGEFVGNKIDGLRANRVKSGSVKFAKHSKSLKKPK